jgi:hypothetical protein
MSPKAVLFHQDMAIASTLIHENSKDDCGVQTHATKDKLALYGIQKS